MKELPVLFKASAVADASGVIATGDDACVLVHLETPDRAVASGRGQLPVTLAVGAAARTHPLRNAARLVERPHGVILPAFVNAHAHLDLTSIGPMPHDPSRGFMNWIDLIRSRRETTPEGIRDAVQLGIELSRRGGTVAVGDIAGAPAGKPTLEPWNTLRDSGLLGVSFVEFFAIGRGAAGIGGVKTLLSTATPRTDASGLMRLGLQPHAPNTVGLAGYRWAVEFAGENQLPLCTHLAETWEEHEFIAFARGPQRVFLEKIGLWEPEILDEIGKGRQSVEHLADVLKGARFTAVHLNNVDDRAIHILKETSTAVVYCPRASTYFGTEHHFGPHRYQQMLAAGIPVALGTDSIVNLDTPQRISVLDEMRLLHRRDNTDPRVLLAMGTVNGALALGLERAWFRFGDGRRAVAGLVAVDVGTQRNDPLKAVLESGSDAELLLDRNYCC